MRPLACPADETLAAFVDGQLSAVERATVVEHLAGCALCREVVGSAAEFADAAESARGVKRGAQVLLALAATLIAALLLYWGVDRRLARPAASPAGALLARHPPARLAGSTWTARPIELGFGVSRTARQRALLWGVAQTDLEVALAASDRERLAGRLDGLCQLLEGWPPAADHYRVVLRRLEQGVLPTAASLEPSAEAVRPGLSEGRWLEAARLAAALGDAEFLADPGLRKRLREVGSLLDEPAAQRLLTSAEAELDRKPGAARSQRIAELLADLLRTL